MRLELNVMQPPVQKALACQEHGECTAVHTPCFFCCLLSTASGGEKRWKKENKVRKSGYFGKHSLHFA